jgi:hypothetical protein
MAKSATAPTLTDRERKRLLAYLDRLMAARKRGHGLLLEDALVMIADITQKKQERQNDTNYIDLNAIQLNKGMNGVTKRFVETCNSLKSAVADLNNLGHLLRPFVLDEDCVDEWGSLGEMKVYFDASLVAKTWTVTAWEAEVIEPMKKHYTNILAHMQALRDRLCGAEAKGEPGRHGCKYEKSVAYAAKVKQRNPETEWREIWKECKRQIDTKPTWKNEKLPPLEKIKNFERVVNRRLKKLAQNRDAT